eukprot:COSAG06_NODE_832_length_12037_cov_81.245854_5_plen_338_part_00
MAADEVKPEVKVVEEAADEVKPEVKVVEEASMMGARDVPKPSPISLLWPAYLCVFVDFMGLAITIPIQPFIADDMGASPGQISALVGVYSIGQLLGNIVMGRVSDRIGRKPVILISLATSTISYVFAGFAEALWVLFLARGMCGICGGTMPVAQAMVLDVVSDFRERPKYLALCGVSLGMGFTIGPAIGAAFVEPLGVNGVFFVCAVLAGLGTIVAALNIQESNAAVIARKSGKPAPTAGGAPAGPPAGPPGAGGPPAGAGPPGGPPPSGFGKVVWACAISMFLNAYCFATMNGLASLSINVQFGWGAAEIGYFLTFIGIFQVRIILVQFTPDDRID